MWTTSKYRKPLTEVGNEIGNQQHKEWHFKGSSELTTVSVVGEVDGTDICLATLVRDAEHQATLEMSAGTEPLASHTAHRASMSQLRTPNALTGQPEAIIAPLQPAYPPVHRVLTPEGLPSYTQLEEEAHRCRQRARQGQPSSSRPLSHSTRVRTFRPTQSQHSIINHPYLSSECPSTMGGTSGWGQECGAAAHLSTLMETTRQSHCPLHICCYCFGSK